MREIPLRRIQLRQLVMSGREVWITLQYLLECRHGLWKAMRIRQHGCVVRVHDGRKRIQRQCYAELLEGLVETLLRHQQGKGVEVVRSGAIGIQFESSLELFLGL